MPATSRTPAARSLRTFSIATSPPSAEPAREATVERLPLNRREHRFVGLAHQFRHRGVIGRNHDRERRDHEDVRLREAPGILLGDDLVAPHVHQPVGAEGHRFESRLEGAHVHHGGESLRVRGRDDRGDRLSVERRDLHVEGAAVLVDDLDPVGALGLARPHPLRGLVRAGQRLHGDPVLRAVAVRGGRGHAGGEEVRLGAAPHFLARGPHRRGEGRVRGLVQHRGHPEAERVPQRREEAVHVAVDEPRDQRVAPPVHAREVLGQVQPLAGVPDPPVLDPHVPSLPEGLAVERRDVHDRERFLGNAPGRALRGLRHRQRREHAGEDRDPDHEPGQAAANEMTCTLHRDLLIEKLSARRNPSAATARKTSVSAARTARCIGTGCPASIAMTLSASCAW